MRKSDVIKHFGSAANLRRALIAAGYGIARSTISEWDDEIPEVRAWQIEEITNGELRRQRPRES